MQAKTIEGIMEEYRGLTQRVDDNEPWPTPVNIPQEDWLRSALQSLLMEADRILFGKAAPPNTVDYMCGYQQALHDCKQVLRNMRGV